ncbi:hypothetical protein BD413DRAFT_483803 [Trametes elegans]|nr:hypothetical protein BD413DRAFT_483803 [Trametes elegans]
MDGQSPPKQRQRSRSRSLTPPPALPREKIERARQAVNSMLGIVARAPSPTEYADDSVDTIVLDPELASVAQRVKAEAQRREGTPIPMGGGPENVKLRVVWKSHPLNPDGRSEELGIVQKRHENFHRVCAEIADLASVRDEQVVLSYDGMRVFPSSTPHSIGIWAEAELEACDRDTFNYLQESKQRMRSESIAPPHLENPSRRSPSRAQSPSNTEFFDSGSPAADSPQEDDKPADTFHLVVRSERTVGKDIHLRVRPTTKCGAIVRAFLRKAGLEDEYPATAPVGKGRGRGKAAAVKAPALSVDGDRMESDTEIGVADLEDGDQVEVVGL